MTLSNQNHASDKIPFFIRILTSKLDEAKHHHKKLQTYTHASFQSKHYSIDQISRIHEDNSDFIAHMRQQQMAWYQQALTPSRRADLESFGQLLNQLETAIYHVLYCIEQLTKPAAPCQEPLPVAC